MVSKNFLLHLARSAYAYLPFSYRIKSRIREVLSPAFQTLMSDKRGLALLAEFRKTLASRAKTSESGGPDEKAFSQLLKDLSRHSNTHGSIGSIIALPFMSSGGAEMVALNFARAFRELQPHRAVLVVIADRPIKSDRIAPPAGVKIIMLHDYLPPGHDHNQRCHFLKLLIQAVTPHIFHNINSETGWRLIISEGQLLTRITRVFASIFAFQYLPGSGRKTGYASYFLQPALPHLHGLLSDNRRFIADAITEYALEPASQAKLHSIYNPSRSLVDNKQDISRIPRGKLLGGPNPRPQILWAGRLDAEKRVDLLYDIAGRCDFADFVVFGQRVMDDDSELPAMPNLVFMGAFTDPIELVSGRTFDAFIFTSRWEGMPNILLEIGLFGIPVVAPVVGGVGELISDATGYPLQEQASAQDYVEALIDIRANPEIAAARARSLKELIQSRHSWDAFVERVKAIPGYIPSGLSSKTAFPPASEKDDPVVSIIIPCYNQGQYLYQSVSSALCAYGGSLEIIVIDDGSTDAKTDRYLAEIASLSKKVKVIRQTNRGLSASRNLGLEIAKGQFVQFLDSDDILMPGKLDAQVAHMCVATELDVSVCNFLLCDDNANHVSKSEEAISRFALTLEDFLYRWERGFSIPIHCALFRREVFAQIRFDVGVKGKEDWLLWCVLAFNGFKIAYLHGHYAIYRQHSNSMRRSYATMGKNWLSAAIKIDSMLASKEPRFFEASVSWFEQYYHKHPEYRQEIARKSSCLPVELPPPSQIPTPPGPEDELASRLLESLSFLSSSAHPPSISVVIPVYNHYPSLEECLLSLANQTYRDFEVICIDDASPDVRVRKLMSGLQNKLSGLHVVTHSRNRGISTCQNEAVNLATGEFVAFLDCDDALPSNALARASEEISRSSDIDYFFSDRWDIDESGRISRLARYGGYYHSLGRQSLRDDLLDGMIASHLKVIRRRTYLRVGGCSSEFDGIQDWELALKISEIGKLAYIPEPLYRHRIHSRSVTGSASVAQFRKTNILRRRYVERWIGSGRLFPTPQPVERQKVARIFDCNTSLPSLAELKDCHAHGQKCVLDLRGKPAESAINFAREFNSYFDLMLWDRPQVPVALLGYLWKNILSPPQPLEAEGNKHFPPASALSSGKRVDRL